jgi:Caspase domain
MPVQRQILVDTVDFSAEIEGMGLTRRAFLQRIGVALGALGLSEVGLSLLGDQYQQAIAQPTRRKLALLVGINQYTEPVGDVPSRGTALSGCLTDVELQRELLIHRFGFRPSDVLSLTDQQATKAAIAEAFQAHLTEQARPCDVVVFHFSGLGSRVKLTDSIAAKPIAAEQNSLVLVDSLLPTAESPVISDLLEETLVLLLRSLPTAQVTTILDAGATTLGKTHQGNLKIRSRPNAPSGRISETEAALLAKLGQARQARSGQFPGLLLSATTPNQVATEAQWNGFSAGLFTYALTQQLWGATLATTQRFIFNQTSGSVRQFAGMEQQPRLEGQPPQPPAIYQTPPIPMSAEGVVRAIAEDGKAQIWLGGLPAGVLENYGASVLTVGSSTESEAGLLQVRSREGLVVKARAANPAELQVGQLVQERVRLLPHNIGLTVAIDTTLERIERVDATSAFSAIPRVFSVIAGEQPADFLFGKTQPEPTLTASLAADLFPGEGSETAQTLKLKTQNSPQTGYGLFYPGRDAISSTLISTDEAVKTAINRLTPQLRTLLATKLLRLTENASSSRLGVRATLTTVAPQERIVLQQETGRWRNSAQGTTPPASRVAGLLMDDDGMTIANGSRVQCRLLNYSDRPVYFMLLGLDMGGNAIAFYPGDDPAETTIPPGDTILLPQTTASSDWIMQATGLAETHVIFSRSPLTQAYQLIEASEHSQADAHRIALLRNPLDVAQAILQDLHQASLDLIPKIDAPAEAYAIDVNAWATLSFIYQVV